MKNDFVASTIVFRPYSLDEALDGIASTPFRLVEFGTVKDWFENIDPEILDNIGTADLQEKFVQRGLIVRSISGHTQLHTKWGARRFRKTLDLAAALGVNVVNTYTGDAGTEAEREQFFQNVWELADYAASLDITIGIETDSNLLPNASEGHWIIDKLDRSNIGMNYDTGNVIYYSGVRPEEDIKAAIPYLVHVHLKDKRGGKGVFDFPQLGAGEIDIASILQTLEAAGYTGPISVEVEFDKRGWPEFEVCVGTLQGCWDYLKALGTFT
jgi:L-ribulose-5-phosphate 3-epimerase